MAMNGNTMGDAVAAAISAAAAGISPTAAVTPAQLEVLWRAACTAIVAHITANAAVAGTVTSGAGAGGGVVGTVA